jgi:hypothetical protein
MWLLQLGSTNGWKKKYGLWVAGLPRNIWVHPSLPSGKLTVRHGKSPFLMAKSTISMGRFQ